MRELFHRLRLHKKNSKQGALPPAIPSLQEEVPTEVAVRRPEVNANERARTIASDIWTGIRIAIAENKKEGKEAQLQRSFRLRKEPMWGDKAYWDPYAGDIIRHISRHAVNYAAQEKISQFEAEVCSQISEIATSVAFFAMDMLMKRIDDPGLQALEYKDPPRAQLYYQHLDAEIPYHPGEVDIKMPIFDPFLTPFIEDKKGNTKMILDLFSGTSDIGVYAGQAETNPRVAQLLSEVINYSIGAAAMEYATSVIAELHRKENE